MKTLLKLSYLFLLILVGCKKSDSVEIIRPYDSLTDTVRYHGTSSHYHSERNYAFKQFCEKHLSEEEKKELAKIGYLDIFYYEGEHADLMTPKILIRSFSNGSKLDSVIRLINESSYKQLSLQDSLDITLVTLRDHTDKVKKLIK